MAYKCIHTAAGLALMTQAEATGSQIRLTHMAVGDGNGNPVTPSEGMTNLVRERFRAPVNRVWQDPNISNKFSAELIVPASAAGFTLREVGVFDSNGTLFVVGNLPDTYKPNASEGSFSDTVIRVDFMVSNASVVQIIADPNVVVATHQWVLNTITVCALLPGGTTGQVLKKKSNACGDTEWADPLSANITVNSIEESQTLAASQTVVDWAVVNNTGLSVYIEGVRLRADQFTKHGTINTRITLAQSYPAGTKIVGVQNEPNATLVDPLAKSLNLADVPDKATARTNLDVFSRSEVRAMQPPGVVDHYAGETPPPGFLVRDGSAISRTAYAALFAVLGTRYGAGDGFNTFNLPDDRGLFDRGFDGGRGIDSGRIFGSQQQDALQNITGSTGSAVQFRSGAPTFSGAFFDGGTGPAGNDNSGDDASRIIRFDASRVARTATETRPANRAYLPIIKF